MNSWVHLTQIPEPIRETMTRAFVPWDRQDLGIEAMVDGMLQAPAVTAATTRAMRASANAIRVPQLVRIVAEAHPDLSIRDVFTAAGLYLGLYPRSVARLYYAERKCNVSNPR